MNNKWMVNYGAISSAVLSQIIHSVAESDASPRETESPSQTSESTSRGASSRKQYGHRRKASTGQRWRHSDKDRVSSTPSPDEALLKPFSYRTRKDRLIDSLQAGGDQRNESNSENEDCQRCIPPSNTRLNNEKLSVAKMVENLQANLVGKIDSNSSFRHPDKKQRRKPSKTPNASKTSSGQTAGNSLNGIPDHDKRVSSRVLKSRKNVMPTGMEEQIIETLIQPRRRQRSLARVETKDSSDSMAIHPKHPTEVLDGKGISGYRKSPPPPPVDFMDASATETESGVRTNACSSAYPDKPRLESNNELEDKPVETAVSRGLPSHLKELKLRFTNDVPRSPYEDNLNDVNKVPLTEKYNTKELVKTASGEPGEPHKFNFTNDVPIVDSLHILASDKYGIKSAKTGGKRTSKETGQRAKNEMGENVEGQGVNALKAAEKRNKKKDVGCEGMESKDKPHKSILKNSTTQPTDDDVINCFTVKTEYERAKMEEDSHKDRRTWEKEERRMWGKEDRRESRRAHKSAVKSSRTQTSCTGLIDTCVQTWPDLELQHPDYRKDAEIQYESSIQNKARQVMRRFSVERSSKKSPPSEHERRDRKKYRNGSTQWEDIDLLVTLSCEKVISKGRERDRNREERSKKERRPSGRTSRKSRSEGKIQEHNCCKGPKNGDTDVANDKRRTEICCMHLQVVPDESKTNRPASKETTKDLELLEKKERRRNMARSCRESEQSLCKRCSKTQFRSSSEGISTTVNYATSSCRSRDLSLLSPFCSKTTVGTMAPSKRKTNAGNKDEDLYRQMEELGLGFLRDGEWILYSIAEIQLTAPWTAGDGPSI